MKKLFFTAITVLAFSSVSMANNIDPIESVEIEVKNTSVEDCCMMVRACWLEGTKTVCGPWIEISVPCDKGLSIEADECIEAS